MHTDKKKLKRIDIVDESGRCDANAHILLQQKRIQYSRQTHVSERKQQTERKFNTKKENRNIVEWIQFLVYIFRIVFPLYSRASRRAVAAAISLAFWHWFGSSIAMANTYIIRKTTRTTINMLIWIVYGLCILWLPSMNADDDVYLWVGAVGLRPE